MSLSHVTMSQERWWWPCWGGLSQEHLLQASSSTSMISLSLSVNSFFLPFPLPLLSLLGPDRAAASEVQAAKRGPAHHSVRRAASFGLRVTFFCLLSLTLGSCGSGLAPRRVPVSKANLLFEFSWVAVRQDVEGRRAISGSTGTGTRRGSHPGLLNLYVVCDLDLF